jgi:hypothetical protein
MIQLLAILLLYVIIGYTTPRYATGHVARLGYQVKSNFESPSHPDNVLYFIDQTFMLPVIVAQCMLAITAIQCHLDWFNATSHLTQIIDVG